jgi:hypothetical protein
MTYYKVVLSGANIFFENASRIDSDTAEPVIGFISCKPIDAPTPELALAVAKRDLLVNWNQSFNSDRKMGMPKLALEYMSEISGWFKPKSTQDYFWFTSEEHKQALLAQFTQPLRQRLWRKETPVTLDSQEQE